MAVDQIVSEFTTQAVLDKFADIILFPVHHPEYVTSLVPLFVGLVVMEIYFGRYGKGERGWNDAVSNSTLLLTTGITLLYELTIQQAGAGPRYTVAYSILVLGTVILILNFYHLWPRIIAFNVSSAFLTYALTYLTIAVIYEPLPLTESTYLAGILFVLSLYLGFTLLKRFERAVVPMKVD